MKSFRDFSLEKKCYFVFACSFLVGFFCFLVIYPSIKAAILKEQIANMIEANKIITMYTKSNYEQVVKAYLKNKALNAKKQAKYEHGEYLAGNKKSMADVMRKIKNIPLREKEINPNSTQKESQGSKDKKYYDIFIFDVSNAKQEIKLIAHPKNKKNINPELEQTIKTLHVEEKEGYFELKIDGTTVRAYYEDYGKLDLAFVALAHTDLEFKEKMQSRFKESLLGFDKRSEKNRFGFGIYDLKSQKIYGSGDKKHMDESILKQIVQNIQKNGADKKQSKTQKFQIKNSENKTIVHYLYMPSLQWFAATMTDQDEVLGVYKKSTRVILATMFVLFFFMFFVFLFIIKYITHKIGKLIELSKKIGTHDYVGTKQTNSADEIGVLTTSLNTAGIKIATLINAQNKLNEELEEKIEERTKELRIIAITDALTGLFNRGHFDKVLRLRLGDLCRQERFLCVLFMDIDHFKNYNDNYGHQEGDKALIGVANAIKSALKRDSDIAFRIGGEELAVLYFSNKKENCSVLSNKILQSIKDANIKHEYSSCSDRLSVSAGLLLLDKQNKKTSQEVYKLADDVLYRAKKEGRNRLIVQSGEDNE